ncbi:MAG: protein-disulfide reductase DsbD domain-containing protein, partial [Pseudomonadota bacterium]
RETRTRPLRDDKIIAGWNGLMIRTLAEASEAFQNPAYSEMAVQAADSLWRRFWDGESLARFWADGAAHEQGALQDYAWVALGFLALGDATGKAVWTDRARLLTAAMTRDFADGTGRLKMAALDGPLGPIYDSTDGAVPSGESSALELLALSARRSTDLALEERALNLKNALSAPLVEQPLLRPDALIAARILDDGESGRRQTLARGTVRAHLSSDRLNLTIADGWHVNAAQPGADWLVGASLQGTGAEWPEGTPFEAGFADTEIRVYDGRVSVPLDSAPSGEIILTLQVCSHEICLEPEEATFRLP